ncbi:MAG: T9SS type A sorting domain-containing protein [Candidatus Marinimicrobia bacterium]|nr:T9SS type A sorting domain-containing protein [Candidatus Neomarinimicrobiota bacterium]
MRSKFSIIILVSFFIFKLYSSDWEVVKTAGGIRTTSRGYFIDSMTGFLVYDDGIVWKTTDGGNTWLVVRDSDGGGLEWNDIEFADENVGYACGESGIIYKTTDGGTNWTQVGDTANYKMDLICLSVVNEEVVFFGGKDSTVLKTTDGGENYEKANYGFEGQDIDGGIAFCNEDVGVAISDSKGGYTFYTYDGGETWQCVMIDKLFPLDAKARKLYCVSAGGDSTIFIGGYHYCGFLSKDGGRTYRLVTPYTSSFEYLISADVVNKDTIVAGGTSGYLIITIDGGESWDTLQTASGQNVELVDFVGDGVCYVFQSLGQWFKTDNYGKSFTPMNEWPSLDFHSIEIIGGGKIIATSFGGGEITISSDSGSSWEYPNNLRTGVNENLNDCEFLNEEVGFITGSWGKILKTDDGGNSWTVVGSPFSELSNRNFYSIGHRGDTVFIAGSAGYLFVSLDGGNTWIGDSYFKGSVNDVYMISDSQIVAVGTGGRVFVARLLNDTIYFDEALTLSSLTLSAVEFRGDTGLIVSGDGIIYRTTIDEIYDTAYTVFTDPDGDCLNDVEFVTETLVFVAGRNRKIYKSDDGGANWSQMQVPQGVGDVEFKRLRYGYNKLWAVGNKGTIISMPLSINKVSHLDVKIADKFIVYPNYPNPFNSSTVISFSIPASYRISINIYNMLGENIRTIVNNELYDRGYYKVVWDGKDNLGCMVPSGVYFYRVVSSDDIQTKRMLLLR